MNDLVRVNSSSDERISSREFYFQNVEVPAFDQVNRWRWDNISALAISSSMEESLAGQLIARGVAPEAITSVSVGMDEGEQIVDNLDFAPESFDVITLTAYGVLHRLEKAKLEATIGRLGEVLKTGGQLFYTGHNPDYSRQLPKGFSRLREKDVPLSVRFSRRSRRARREMGIDKHEQFDKAYVKNINSAAEVAGLSVVELHRVLNPKYNPDPSAELSYLPYRKPVTRVAGLFIKKLVVVDQPLAVQLLELEAGPQTVLDKSNFKLLTA